MVLTTEEIWKKCIPLTLDDDLNVLQLHPTHQFILAIAHSELSDKNFENHVFSLQQIHHIYIIAQHFSTQIDWQAVNQHFVDAQQEKILSSMLFNLKKLFQYVTPITHENIPLADNYIEVIIDKYVLTQGYITRFQKFKAIVKGYNKETVLYHYGENGLFPILTGRLKHLIRHIKIITKRLFKLFL